MREIYLTNKSDINEPSVMYIQNEVKIKRKNRKRCLYKKLFLYTVSK